MSFHISLLVLANNVPVLDFGTYVIERLLVSGYANKICNPLGVQQGGAMRLGVEYYINMKIIDVEGSRRISQE
ncbi:MAG: hypothetical protein WBH83_09430 [Methanosarcina flavescens]